MTSNIFFRTTLVVLLFSVGFVRACNPSEGVGDWPAESTGSAGHLAQLDSRLETQQSGAFWNEQTDLLWTTTGGNTDADGTFALAYSAATNDFSLFAQWDSPRGEDLTQVVRQPVNIGGVICHQVYFIDEDTYAIIEALMAEPAAPARDRAVVPSASELAKRMATRTEQGAQHSVTISPGESQVTRRWVISELVPSGKKGAEAISFVSDVQLAALGFVDGQGRPWTQSRGGLGGLMFVGHQVKGIVYAIDLSATGTAIFPNERSYAVVGAYQTAYPETSALFFDASIGRMYLSHNTDGNHVEVSDLTSVPLDSADAAELPSIVTRRLRNCWIFDTPSEFNNPEGFACSSFLSPNGQGRNQQTFAFWANDAEGSHHTQRSLAVTWFQQFNPAGTIDDNSLLVQQAPASSPHTDPSALTVGPFVVQLFDSHGYPVVDTAGAISCRPLDPQGSIEFPQPATNATGFASCGLWTLDPTAFGTQQLLVATSSTQTTFTAVLLHPSPSTESRTQSTTVVRSSTQTSSTTTTTTTSSRSTSSTSTTTAAETSTTSTTTTTSTEVSGSNSALVAILVVVVLAIIVGTVVLIWYIRMVRLGNQAPEGFAAVPLELDEYEEEEEEEPEPTSA